MSVDMVELEVFILADYADDDFEDSGHGFGCTSPEHYNRMLNRETTTRYEKYLAVTIRKIKCNVTVNLNMQRYDGMMAKFFLLYTCVMLLS